MYWRSTNPEEYPVVEQPSNPRSNSKIKFISPRPSSEHFRNIPLYQGSIPWNTLDVNQQLSETYCEFKNKMSALPIYHTPSMSPVNCWGRVLAQHWTTGVFERFGPEGIGWGWLWLCMSQLSVPFFISKYVKLNFEKDTWVTYLITRCDHFRLLSLLNSDS